MQCSLQKQYGRQWRIYIEAKEAVLGGPQTQRAPQIYNIKKMFVE